MANPNASASTVVPRRVLFVTRDPVVHQLGGSTTYALALLEVLQAQGAQVTIVATLAAGRSPRPFFVARAPLPAGIALRLPGYLRLGRIYLRVWAPRAWARYLLRAAVRWPFLAPIAAAARALYGDSICGYAWDLTEPTAAERKLVLDEAARIKPSTLLGNYAYWGPVLADPALLAAHPSPRRVLLLHDLLSARVRSFESQGRELDCPAITEATEFRWLNGAETLLAAQAREAEAIRPHVQGKVIVLPVTMTARPSFSHPETNRCLFVGSRIAPNESALAWLLDEVWPIVLRHTPHACLAVVGTVASALPGGDVRGVEAIGPVPSLEDEYQRAAVCLVPLRIGSGIKIKLLEALSFGKAIVSTSVGVEGIEAETAGVVEVADEAQAFAAHIVALLGSEDLRRRHERAAHALALNKFDPLRQIDPAFLNAVL